MRYPTGSRDEAEARREAASWAAKMRGQDADCVRLEFERWRAASPLHRRLYDEMDAISRDTRRLAATPYGRDYQPLPQRRPLFARPELRLAAAGVLAVILVGGALFLHRPGSVSVQHPGAQAIASATGQLRRLRLPDGSNVVLDTDTRIEVAFNQSARLVRLLGGRARFDVAPGQSIPFMVEAGHRVILDRGTVFDVALGRDGVKVSLLRGAVEIHDRTASGAPGKMVARLAPGQLAVAAAGHVDAIVATAPAGADHWVDGVLNYDGARLADVVADIDRYSTRKLRLGDSSLADLRVTGVFRPVPLESAAQVLAAALGLHVVTGESGDLILKR